MTTAPSPAPAPAARPTTGRPRLLKWAIYALVAGLVSALIASQLPREPFSTELDRIGNGRPSVVLAYDIQTMGGMEVMAMLRTLRPAFADRVQFLVAPLGAPHGQAFGRRHQAVSGTVVLFTETGIPVHTLHGPADAAELQRALDGLLAFGIPR